MKKALGLLLSFMLVMNVTCISVKAGTGLESNSGEIKDEIKDKNDGLERAIDAVKAKLSIPPSYTEFSSEMNNYDNKSIWQLRWYSKDEDSSKDSGSLEVGIDSRGNIESYNQYKYRRGYEYRRWLPKLSKTQAVESAKKFIYYMSPEIVDEVSFDEHVGSMVEFDGNYRLVFYRTHNGVPFFENQISILISGETGEIMSYNRNWLENISFPDKSEAMDSDAAKKIFKEKSGFTLKYRKTYDGTENKTYLEYSPANVNMDYSIDAITGELTLDNSRYSIQYGDAYSYDPYRRGYYAPTIGGSLTKEQTDEIKEIEALVSVEEAEKALRSIDELGITQDYTLNNYSMSRYGSNGYVFRMDFARPVSSEELSRDIPEEKVKAVLASGGIESHVNIIMDARNCEVMSVNSYGNYGNKDVNTGYQREDMKKTAEGFLSKYKKEKFVQLKLVGQDDQLSAMQAKYAYYDPGNDSSFAYFRTVNGIPFEDNQISLQIDPSTGKIIFYNEMWDSIEFVSSDEIISLEQAYEVIFNKSGLLLKYIIAKEPGGKPAADEKKAGPITQLKLVYGLDYRKPAIVDAKKGILITNYNGEPYQELSSNLFNDIRNESMKEKVKALAEAGIIEMQEKFRPDELVTQKYIMSLISKIKGYYSTSGKIEDMDQTQLDGFYRALINEGILDEAEKNPDDPVTREQAVKYILKSMGYKKFAEMEGIFKCDYSDMDQMDPKSIGYVVIAASLGITPQGEYAFYPKKELTRADAALMIYNCLKR